MSSGRTGVTRSGPGRPATGARERILEACLEVLKSDGYAGLTIAKIAAAAGENKALVSYYFGSKQGAVAAAARELGEMITRDVLNGLGRTNTLDDVIRGSLDGLWQLLDRDERLARVYFDLNAVSVVEGEVREVMREVKQTWRAVLSRLLADAEDGIRADTVGAAAVLVIAGNEGLCLERIERGETAELRRARELFVSATVRELASR